MAKPITPAPVYVEQFLAIQDRGAGLERLMAMTSSYVAQESARLHKDLRLLWNRLETDYGVKFGPGSGWVFRSDTHTIEMKKEDSA